jgi:mannose-6-phosphate isomerase-like protein (cupin superfamily)
MANPGDRYALTAHETLTVLSSSPELLELDAEWHPTEKGPPKHFHPAQDERFEVREGELHVHLDGTLHVVRAGEQIDVPRGGVHSIWAGGGTTTRALWQVRPALRTAEFMAAMEKARGARPVVSPIAALPVLREYSDVFRLAIPVLGSLLAR